MNMEKIILKYALQNALKFGKTNPGAVIGKVIQDMEKSNISDTLKGTKKDPKEIAKLAQEIIKKVNSMKPEEIQKELEKIAPELLEKKKTEKKHLLKELTNVKKGKVVMRFAPSPSGPMHLGHAYGISLSSEYCKKYNGQLILRIEDTNPENIYEPAYGMLPEDGKWITKDNIAKVIIQSDRLGVYYDYADKLIEMKKGYVCTCTQDHFRELINEKKTCPCRNKKDQHQRFAKMFSEYKAGEAVLRIKTDVKHKNPAMRDFPLMRINDHEHPRQGTKFRVWPLMNFSVFVDDVELGMTHIIRAKEHMDNGKRQMYLYNYFNKKIPEMYYVGRINFSDLRISCSKTKVLIQEGKYEDWSDIRLPFLVALKRRGYLPEAFIKYSTDVGMTQNDKTVSAEEFFKALNHFNKEVLDAKANRYFFIADPKEITIKKAPKQEIKIDLHPDYPKKGKRKFDVEEKYYISGEDHAEIKSGVMLRLMDCINFEKKGKEYEYKSKEYEKYKKAEKKKIMHWLPVNKELIEIEIRMPDNTFIYGLAEPAIAKLKIGDICQLERFGFCRLDSKGEKLRFWYGHR